MPEDESDLAYFLGDLADDVPVTVDRPRLEPDRARRRRAGRGDPARPRLQRDRRSSGNRVRAGAAVPDVKVARAAQEAGIAGLAFLRGIPGAIGGALRMNGGAYGRETKDVADRGARRRSRTATSRVLRNADMHYTYRHCGVARGHHLHRSAVPGTPGDPAAIAAEMDKITEAREATQPIKSRTGGSTFKNPPGPQGLATDRRRRLPRAGGRRRAGVGDALQFPDQSAAMPPPPISKTLGETVRGRVKENSGVELEWEIKRIGVAR